MKNPISAALVFVLVFGGIYAAAADAECVPLKPGEVKVSEAANDHGGKTLYRRWAIDSKTTCDERIVMNKDNSVRGRVITTYLSGKPISALAFKGMIEPWFIDQYTWRDERGHSVERRSHGGDFIFKEISTSDDKGLVKTLDSAGNEMTDERYKQLADEVADLLF